MSANRPKEPPPILTPPGALGRIFKMFAAAAALFVVSAVMHNAIFAFFQVDEPVFLLLATFVAPVLFAVGLMALVILFFRRLAGVN